MENPIGAVICQHMRAFAGTKLGINMVSITEITIYLHILELTDIIRPGTNMGKDIETTDFLQLYIVMVPSNIIIMEG
jgi:hypothetical protein